MKLNIYDKKEIIKTYEADEIDLPFGILEDLSEAFNIEKLTTGSNQEIMEAVMTFLRTSTRTAYEILHDVFPEITDAEIRKTRTSEIAQVLVDALGYSMASLMTGIKKSKNLQREGLR